MKLESVYPAVEGIPYMTRKQAEMITEIILTNEYRSVLELGFFHGVSSCYIAAALDELGGGHLTTIDLENARAKEPNVEQLLEKLGLRDMATVYYEPTSYLWRMMLMLDESPEPRFDLCYLDGGHSWFASGFAFFLVDRLLNPGGMIIFDDLDWTHASSQGLKDSDKVKAMPEDERTTPQIRKVYELLVKPHPAYGDFQEKNDWAYARKLTENQINQVRREVVYVPQNAGVKRAIKEAIQKRFIRRTK